MNKGLEQLDMQRMCDRGIINQGNLARMKKVFDKASSGEAINIGFIGGSITAGSIASTPESCYAYRVYSWWRSKFPNSSINYINAGVGATTSQYGVARVQEDLLPGKPDVIFAEFSVNDPEEELFKETFEGLLRRILLDESEPALVMFNNVFYHNGKNAQQIHNEVGKYYDLPIVSMRESIYRELEAGTLERSMITPDDLHPNDLGHSLVAAVITNLLDKLYTISVNITTIAPYTVPDKALTKNRYIGSHRWNNLNSRPLLMGFVKDEVKRLGGWDVFKGGWVGGRAGDYLLFEVESSFVSVQYIKYAEHPAPVARVVIDRDEKHAVILDANFEETWGDCLFLQDIMIAGKYGKHVVEITITEAVKDKPFYLAAVITA